MKTKKFRLVDRKTGFKSDVVEARTSDSVRSLVLMNLQEEHGWDRHRAKEFCSIQKSRCEEVVEDE